MADHHDVVNIRDEQGKSTWPEKNTEEMIDAVLSKISTRTQQGEYFNNPITEGKIFPSVKWGKVPPLARFPFLMIYADPTTSEAKGIAIGEAKGKIEGKIEGTENTIRSFIERKRSRHVSEEDIFEELRLDFGLDIQSACRYMEPSLANA